MPAAETSPRAAEAPTIACVVPATNVPPTLDRCLTAIRGAERPPEKLVVIVEPPGDGPAAARNAGAEQAGGEILVFVDADVIVHADAFRRIREAFEQDPTLAALFGSYDDEPEDPGVVSGFRNLLHHHVHQHGDGTASTFWAGLGAVRRDAFERSGGFDAERYPAPSIEDVELGMRLSAAGERIRLDPRIQGTHLKAWTLGQMVRTDYSSRGLPWARLLLGSGGTPTTLNLGWRHRLSALASVAAALALILRQPRRLALALLALLALNARFYALLWRKRGPSQAAAGVGLHALHHLTGSASAAAAVIEACGRRARSGGLDE